MTTDHTPSRACYQHGCSRPECKQADYQYMSRLRLERHRGQRRRCDSTQTRHHIERLLAAGWTQAQIARAAGLAHRTVGAVEAGTANVSKRTALAILSVLIGPAPTDTRDVDATGTTRRLRALAVIGWPIEQLSPQLGIYPTALGNIARGELRNVRATTAHAVALLYQHLIRQPGPSDRSRILASKKGWHGPAAWDDIDDPSEQPEETDARILNFHERAALRREEIIHLAWHGDTPEQIHARLGGEVSISTVRQIVLEWRTGQKRQRKQPERSAA
ncbi:helix-turn-helix transcriptional regulator [Streptomyces sp. MMS24-I2-30]|uniref:helix-turn-helix transcriptional regulator n=1 Tax=Streptomyces sp. MMS24-I2-30 TaxID=3351564 RepID=UPI003896EE02